MKCIKQERREQSGGRVMMQQPHIADGVDHEHTHTRGGGMSAPQTDAQRRQQAGIKPGLAR